MERKAVIVGSSGFLGEYLRRHLESVGWQVVGVSRGDRGWDGKSRGSWESQLTGASAVINYAGAPITLPWTSTNRDSILSSRLDSTRVLGQAMLDSKAPPPVWINASAVGFYGDRKDEILDEFAPAGTGFLAEVCLAWEDALVEATLPATRRIALRTGIVLGPGGGAMAPLAKLARLGLGGDLGNGKSWMPWIHIKDHARMVEILIESHLSGPVNAVGPAPATNHEFAQTLRQIVGCPIGIPTPAFALTLASKLGGPDPSVLLNSTRVVPKQAQQAGFTFDFSDLGSALADCLRLSR
jgi:uncharacterized protein (TIGR01777 family)